MPKQQITIGDYLLTRLKELGIECIFGVPGDYNLGFLDQIENFEGIKWIGTCNELNGAYAADGYARIKGAGALLTTFGVGELSAVNGIAGAYAEYVPIVNLVGIPSTSIQRNQSVVHHTLGDGRFTVFFDMYKDITAAQTLLTKANAAKEIDSVLVTAWLKKRPIYIGIPSDISYLKINAPTQPLNLSYPSSNDDSVKEFSERAAGIIKKAKSPLVLIDICAQTHPMKPLILDFLSKTGLPFATMNMGKSIINESHLQFIGNYNGDFGTEGVQQRVEDSDCVISFGSLLSDFNTGGFTAKINANVTIEIHSYYARIKQSVYDGILFKDTIPALTRELTNYRFQGDFPKRSAETYTFEKQPLKHKRMWQLLSHALEKNAIVISETGTSMFGTLQMPMPDDATFIGQYLWSSIGYSVGALLGACLAAPTRQVVLFVGDGSFQLTAQELSTIERHDLTPTIFLLNNDGYTVERVIHGAKMEYNDIQKWNYAEFPKMFNKEVWTTTVKTEKELEAAIKERKEHKNEMALIELILEKMDAPDSLIKIGKATALRNQYEVKEVE